jgi:hypothetical protein
MKTGLAALALSLAAGSAMAADGEARGQLVVGGRTTPLTHACAVPQRDGEMLLLLSDQPLSNKAIKDVFERIHMADEGKLHAVEMLLDSKRTPTSVSMRHEGFKGHGGGYSSSHHTKHRSTSLSPSDMASIVVPVPSGSAIRSGGR